MLNNFINIKMESNESFSKIENGEGGQCGTVVKRPPGNQKDVGSNPAPVRKMKKGYWSLAQKVPQWSNRISVEDL